LAPASTVTDGLAAGDAAELLAALLAPVALDGAGAPVELLDPPLLQASPVMAASAARPAAATGARLLLVLLPSVLVFIGGTPLFLREGGA